MHLCRAGGVYGVIVCVCVLSIYREKRNSSLVLPSFVRKGYAWGA
jgi:hypothetical protein